MTTLKSPFDVKEIGVIQEIRKAIVRIRGLPSCAYGQPLVFPGGGRGMVIGFDKDEVSALLFSDVATLKSGDPVYARSETFEVPVGDNFLGRIVNGLAEPCDNGAPISASTYIPIFSEAPGIMDRDPLTRQLLTGTKVLDTVIPIAKGQRQLLIGDRVTGKTTLAVDAILNQRGKDVICIYCCIGRSYNFLLKLTQLLKERGTIEYTVMVSSAADAPAGEQYLAPYTAACIGEHFMRRGKDVLVIFDDLTKHAWIWRQISLLMDRSPGREAYPGDIFYVHSRLMERAGQLNKALGGGSMTFLPIVETQQGDVTGYIPSNLISMTDGQIYLSTELFQEGFKPAVDLGLSVSRIGNKIQCQALRSLCGPLRLEYLQFKELLNMTKLRSIVSKEGQLKIMKGHVISEILKQSKNEPVDLEEEIILLAALRSGALDALPIGVIQQFKKAFYWHVRDTAPGILERLRQTWMLTDEMKAAVRKSAEDFAGRMEWA